MSLNKPLSLMVKLTTGFLEGVFPELPCFLEILVGEAAGAAHHIWLPLWRQG